MTTDNCNSHETTIEALSTSLMGIDGARRVGWAKAFSAMDQLETASAELNNAKADIVMYRDRVSYLWGYVSAILEDLRRPGYYALLDLRRQTRIESSKAGDTAFLDRAQVHEGRDHAMNLMENLLSGDGTFSDPEKMLAEKARKRLAKRAKDKKQRIWEEEQILKDRVSKAVDAASMKRAYYQLLTECGFETKDELKRALRILRIQNADRPDEETA